VGALSTAGVVDLAGASGGVANDHMAIAGHLADGPSVGKSEVTVGDATECPQR
jgi:hypothetical protein